MPSQEEYNVTKQKHRVLYCKINLLNFNFEIIDELSGVVIGEPTFTVNADSDIRRTCGISLYPKNSSFDISRGNIIWLDKYIQVYIGIKDDKTKEVIYTNMGIYLVDAPNTTYSATENLITISGLDLMAKLTGLRNGNLMGMEYLIPSGSNIKKYMLYALQLGGFPIENQLCQEAPSELPYDINISRGGTIYGMMSQLRDVYPNYQIYFDVNGVFHYEPIPSGDNEQIMVDDDIWKNTLVSYTKQTDFSSVKNVVEVYGKTHDIYNFATEVTQSNDTYSLNIPSVTKVYNGLTIGFVANSKIDGDIYLSINGTDKYKLLDEYGKNPTLLDEEDVYYVAQYIEGKDYYTIEEIDEDVTNVASIVSNTFYLTDETIKELSNNTTLKFKTPNRDCEYAYLPSLKLNNFSSYEIENVINLDNNKSYKITFNKNSEKEELKHYEFLGEVTPHYIAENNNKDSQFYIGYDKIPITLSGGIYDNIYSTELAKQMAEHELYLRCNLQDNVTITTLPIYWLDVNQLIEITLPNKNGKEETVKYITKSINTTLSTSGTQSITMMRYYPS